MPAFGVDCFKKFMSTMLILIQVGFGVLLVAATTVVKNRIPSPFDLVFDSQEVGCFKENCLFRVTFGWKQAVLTEESCLQNQARASQQLLILASTNLTSCFDLS